MDGYHNRLLSVDLSRGAICVESLPEQLWSDYVGGSGVATRLLYDRITLSAEPDPEQDPLIVMAGPLTGTRAPMCGRHTLVGRSPLTGWLGESSVGGHFGAELRRAGYDGLIVAGRSEEPVWLWIGPQGAGLRSAAEMWGLETFATQEAIRAQVGDARARVASIGPAGEKGVLYAGIAHDNARMAARTGLGAVMGAKGLKAIAVRAQPGSLPPLANGERLAQISREMRVLLQEDTFSQVLRTTGTAGNLDYLNYLGALPARYFTLGDWPAATEIGGGAMSDTILSGVEACFGCPVACGRQVTLPAERYNLPGAIKGPEYETLGALGSQLLIDDLPALAYLGRRCDALGIDTISAGNTIALAVYLYQEGILRESDVDGLHLAWGDPALVEMLLEKAARREGLGELLAQGSRRLAAHLGAEELAVHFNGMSPAMHDPRAYSGMALAYGTSPVGGSHNHSAYYLVESCRPIEDLGISSPGCHEDEGKAAQVARDQDWSGVLNSLVTCLFANAPAGQYIELLNAATGRELDAAGALEIGERIFCLQRALNIRLGYTPAGEKLPRLLREALTEGGAAGFMPNEALLYEEYYRARAWDRASGRPSREKLVALGLRGVADDIWTADERE